MIGQTKLLNRIDKFTIESFPQASIFEGEVGCGKKSLVTYVGDKFSVPVTDITLQITSDLILDLYSVPSVNVYTIDIDVASSSKRITLLQNAILKFVEEPPQYSKIIILVKNKSQLLPTIQNRCQIFSFEKYTTDVLKQFSAEHGIQIDEELYRVYDTPGKLLSLTEEKNKNVDSLIELVNNVIDNISRASIPNTLTLVNKIDFGSGGFDLSIFLSMMRLELVARMKLADTNYIKLKKYYTITSEFSYRVNMLGVNKQTLFENYLMKLKMV